MTTLLPGFRETPRESRPVELEGGEWRSLQEDSRGRMMSSNCSDWRLVGVRASELEARRTLTGAWWG
jgi:hypothetical protein